MSWEERDSLDETWLPTWSGDDGVLPEKEPEAPKPDDAPPDAQEPTDEWTRAKPDCRVNLALWWLALLQDGPPPEGDWVEFVDFWDGPTEIRMTGYEFGEELLANPEVLRSPGLDAETEAFMLDVFREEDGGDLEC